MRVSALLIATVAIAACSSSTSPEGVAVEAELEVSPSGGTVITDFEFDASGSSTGNRALQFRWDWESDGTWDTGWSADAVVTHRFAEGDTITTTVEASADGETDTASATFTLDRRHGHVLETFDCPIFIPDVLGYDGTSLWCGGEGRGDRLWEIDPATVDTIRSIPAPSLWPGGIAWDGTSLWVSDYIGGMKIFEVDPADGTIISSFDCVYTEHAAGLAWDGSHLYHGSRYHDNPSADGLIHKYTRDGTEVGTLPCPAGSTRPNGLSYDGQHLWVRIADVDTLYVVDKNDGAVFRSVPLEHSTADHAVAGSYVWVIEWVQGYRFRRIVP